MIEKSKETEISLDRIDKAILGILQSDNKMSQRQIAELVHLSAPAVQRRIKRLEDTGVIQANVAIIDPAKVGQPVILLVAVTMESERNDLHESAKQFFSAAPEVQQCYYVTGDADFILVISVRSMSDYKSLTRRLFFGNNNVRNWRTFVSMDRVKVGLSIPVT